MKIDNKIASYEISQQITKSAQNINDGQQLLDSQKNQEIKPHPEPYAVFFFILEGRGIFTGEEGEKELNKGDSIFMDSDKIRGIKCIDKLSILGVQDGH